MGWGPGGAGSCFSQASPGSSIGWDRKVPGSSPFCQHSEPGISTRIFKLLIRKYHFIVLICISVISGKVEQPDLSIV